MLPRLLAHLDFKGIQRTPDALLQYLETLAGLGYDGLLVEYEDVFPFAEASFSMTPEGRWSREFLMTFLAKAKSLGLAVIPLQQSLGHMEYMFRWERYHSYRLAQEATGEAIDSTTLHIKSESARAWLKGLLGEMIAAHPDSEYIHLGMDEASPVSAYAYESKLDALTLFLDWLEELCDLCEAAGKKPLIWSDMLEEHINPRNIARLQALKDRIILVCWEYLSGPNPVTEVRFGGWRVSWGWRDCPRDLTPTIQHGRFKPIEEWPPEIAAMVGKYRVGDRHLEPLFPAAVLKELGVRAVAP
jgi:hexosaminidase